MTTVTYPFDPTGSNPLARITNEQHVLTSLNNTQLFQTIIPSAAPFFTDNIIITFNNPDTSVRVLTEGVDYYFTHQFISASKATAKPVAGSITFLDRDITGVLRITYQTIGGAWVLDDNEIAEILANMIKNPRITAWEQITDLPFQFPVIDHEWNLSDMVGATEIVEGINDIRDAVLAGNAGGIAAHVNNTNNPHETTKVQVGLGDVENYPIATQTQAQTGTNNTSYMTPLRVTQAINALGGGVLAAHITRVDNPHEVTKAQVGLGSVENYPIASSTEATTGTANDRYMTPLRVKSVVDVVSTALSAHTASQSNPHNTTKSQVGLNNVQNYDIATAVESQAGTVNDKYMTPLRTAQAITALASTGLTAHLLDSNNPHNTTKLQVGLGLVDNYQVASQLEAEAGVMTNRFMTPQRTAQAITFQIGQSFVDHLNATNPHGVTAAQVNLGSVQNYTISSQAEAEAGDLNTRYMTPLRTKQAIAALASGNITSHTLDTNNPHQTTKAQVGLGNVENYGIASQTESEDGNATDRYMTPLGTYQSITHNAIIPLNAHVNDINNPHQTTKTQVGLGNVQDYGIATQSQAEVGSDNSTYVTPLRVKQAIDIQVLSSLNTHIADGSNPHNVSKAQVGLGSVQNYPIADQSEAQTGDANDRYMTPLRVKQAIAVLASGDIAAHTLDMANPHNTTATQVGLGSVQNYGIATQAEAEAGTVNDKYMTPFRTKQEVDVFAVIPLNTHIARTDNPHAVTAAQVGLGNVSNYSTASQAEAEAGVATDKYMTPLRTYQAITALATGSITTHIANTSNPHSVTKAQVGLSDVENYGIATQVIAETGTSNSYYMTPQRTAQAIASQVGSTVSSHVTNTSNPHNTTAAQIGTYTTTQIDSFLSGKLGSSATAANSSLLEGKSAAVLESEISLSILEGAGSVFAPQTHAAKMAFNSGLGDTHTWVQLGGLSLDDTSGNENSPLCWLISGIGLNDTDDITGATPNYSLNTYILTATIAENLAGTDVIANVQLKYLTSGGNITVSFRQKTDATLKELTFYMRLPNGFSQFSITNLNPHGYQGVDIVDVGPTTPASTTVLTPSGDGDLAAHIADTANPHAVTKTQVGLGSVDNYATASQSEAQTGTDNAKFMTPLRTAQAITSQVGTTLSSHVANTSNPHSTTATQVGLGSVQNYGIATQAEAEAGTVTNKYMTPERTKQAITLQVEAMLTTLLSEVTAGFTAISNAMSGVV